jgi:hypothetical protein
MSSSKHSIRRLLALGIGMTLIAYVTTIQGSADRVLGQNWKLGKGAVTTYAEFADGEIPSAVGVVFSKGALQDLPSVRSDWHHCFDRNADGTVEDMECFASHEAVIPLPDAVATRDTAWHL